MEKRLWVWTAPLLIRLFLAFLAAQNSETKEVAEWTNKWKFASEKIFIEIFKKEEWNR